MRTIGIALVSAALILGCGSEGGGANGDGAYCESNADCGSGTLCDTTNKECESAYNGINGVSQGQITVGNSSSITTGNAANLGLGMVNGLNAAFNHWNSIGGVHGRQLELDARDDGYNPPRAVENVRAMITPRGNSREVFALVGNMGSPTSAETIPIANEFRTLFFGALSGAGHLRKTPPDRYVFNYRASYKAQTTAVTRHYLSVRLGVHARNIAVFAQGEVNGVTTDKCTWDQTGTPTCADDEKNLDKMDAYGRAGFDGVVAALEAAPYRIRREEIPFATHTRNKQDVQTAVGRFLKWLGRAKRSGEAKTTGKFDAAIVAQIVDKPGAALIQQLKDEVENIKSTGTPGAAYASSLTSEEIEEIKNLDKLHISATVVAQAMADTLSETGQAARLCANVLALQAVPHPDSQSTLVRQFREHMDKLDKDLTKDVFALEGYVAGRIWIQALERQGKDITTESMVDTLESMRAIDIGLGVPLGFSPQNHDASSTSWAQRLNDKCEYEAYELSK